MSDLVFSARIRINGVNPYVLVSGKRAQGLKRGWRRPIPVLVRINGLPKRPWRINMVPKGDGSFYLYLHGNLRKAAGSGVGDTVNVRLSLDSGYRNGPQHPMPRWLSAPLSKNKAAKSAWLLLPPSRKKEVLRYLHALKSDGARERNLRRALAVLSGSNERFMGREWKDGR